MNPRRSRRGGRQRSPTPPILGAAMTTPDQPSVQPFVLSGRRAIWPWVAATVAALAAAVTAGVTVTLLSNLTGGPSAASSPSDTTDNDRWVCRAAADADRAEPGTYV